MGTLFPSGVTSLTHTHLPIRGPHTLLACLLTGLLSGRTGPQACSLSALPAPTYGRFMMFFSLLSGVWLLVSMAKQEFPNGLFPIWAGQTLMMTLPAAAVREVHPSEPPFHFSWAHGCLTPRPHQRL